MKANEVPSSPVRKFTRPHTYFVNVSWSKDRLGMLCSPDIAMPSGKADCIEVATPPQFPKGIPGIWSPEHLFTAAVSSCLMTTFLALAEKAKLEFTAFSCPAEGKLDRSDEGLVMTEITLHPTITIPDETFRELGNQVLRDAVDACLISKSIKSKVVANSLIQVAVSEATLKNG